LLRLILCHTAVFALLPICLCGISIRAQNLQSATPTLTVNARLVVLDLVVTDQSGKPVDGLTQRDFKILQDGQPQTIRSFEPPSAHGENVESTTQSATAQSVAAPLDPARPAEFGVAPVTILVLDQLNTHFADSSYARRELGDYIRKQPATLAYPATLFTLYENHTRQLQGFTRDRAALLKALAAAPVENAWQLEQTGKADYGPAIRMDQSLHALEDIAQSVASIRGRKNLVWIGGGFPSIDPRALDTTDAQEVKRDLEHITNLLLDTRVTLYAVDPTSSAAGMTEITDDTQLEFAAAAGDALTTADPYDVNADFDRLAPITGGRVIRGMNNIDAQISNALALGTNYYTLSYTPSSSSTAGDGFRSIRVLCLRPGLTVSTRKGFYPPNPQQEKSDATISYDLSSAAESTVPLHGLHVTVSQPPSAQAGTFLVHVDARELTWEPGADGNSLAHVEILAASLSRQNKVLGHTLHAMTASMRSNANPQQPGLTADFAFPADVAPKATTLRFVVRDATTGRMGSFDLHLAKP
jgi:VWFA-related protein